MQIYIEFFLRLYMSFQALLANYCGIKAFISFKKILLTLNFE